MVGSLTIRRARLVLPDRVVVGDVVVVDGVIEQIGPALGRSAGEEIDAEGRVLLPGVIDTLVDVPLGLSDDGTPLARLTTEAAREGITSMVLFDPVHPASDAEALDAQRDHATRHARVRFGVYAAPDEAADGRVPDHAAGVRLSIGRGTAPSVDAATLDALVAAGGPVLVVDGQDDAACARREALYAEATDPAEHVRIYPPEVALASLARVVGVARKHGRRVHLPRVSSGEEVRALAELGAGVVSSGVTIAHLFLEAERAVARLGTRAVTDPPLRGPDDVAALWRGLLRGVPGLVASGHAVVRAADKDTPYPRTPRGLPMAPSLLPLLLDRCHRGDVTLVQVARWTADAPARLLGLPRTGRIEVGFDADLVLVDLDAETTLVPGTTWSGWSPFDGFTLRGRPVLTVVAGRAAVRDGVPLDGFRGGELPFARA